MVISLRTKKIVINIKILLTFVIPLLVLGGVEKKETADLGEWPNNLLIVADDFRSSDIGSLGGEIITPTLDTKPEQLDGDYDERRNYKHN